MKKLAITTVFALILAGCATTYTKQTDSIGGVNVPDKMVGSWTYSIDDSIKDARRTNFKPGGQVCSAHIYNLDASVALESALRKGMQEFFENGSELKSPAGKMHHVAFRLESFQPRFSCTIGATEGYCNGTAEITMAVTVIKESGRRSFTVTSERSADGSAGSMCSTALNAPSEAVRKASKDVVERVMERLLSVGN
jgi:uncharacterized lipoprotein YmbA